MKHVLGLVATIGLLAGIVRAADAPASVAATAPAATQAADIVIDTSETPDLKEWAEKQRPVWEKWYPMIIQSLPSDGYTAPAHVTITFRKDMKGVAYTMATHIECAGSWFNDNRDTEGPGAVVHELVHVVQQYHHRSNPGWLVEGIADYIRWFKFEPETQRPHPDPRRAHYNDSYRTTAAFLDWAVRTCDADLIRKLNTACREGKYKPEIWKQLTGKTADELGAQWKASLQGPQ